MSHFKYSILCFTNGTSLLFSYKVNKVWNEINKVNTWHSVVGMVKNEMPRVEKYY